jgi:hypothetical protein
LRDVDDRVGMTRDLAKRLVDDRGPSRVFSAPELTRTLVYLVAQGWRDLDDADLLRHDPALGLAVSDDSGTSPLTSSRGLPSQPTLSRVMGAFSIDDNRRALRDVLRQRAIAVRAAQPRQALCVIDVDSFPIECHGHQKGAVYNGHYRQTMYNPLVATFGDDGDFIDVVLRPGNAHTAQGASEFVAPILDSIEGTICDRAMLRIDAGFPTEDFLAPLEKRSTAYVARLRNNKKLDRMAAPLINRPRGRPPKEPRTFVHDLLYRAGPWSRARRVVLAVQEPKEGELFFSHFWLVTNLTREEMSASDLVELYRQRGTAEARFGDFMTTLDPALSSTRRINLTFKGRTPRTYAAGRDPMLVNEARLLIFALAANLMRAVQRLLDELRSLRGVRERVLRAATRIVVHARRITMAIERSLAPIWQRLLAALEREPELA